jgi:hypothetical protein
MSSPLARGPPLGRKRARVRARVRARAWGGLKTLSPAQQRRDPFSFSFSTFFLIYLVFFNILCTKNYPNNF